VFLDDSVDELVALLIVDISNSRLQGICDEAQLGFVSPQSFLSALAIGDVARKSEMKGLAAILDKPDRDLDVDARPVFSLVDGLENKSAAGIIMLLAHFVPARFDHLGQ